MGKHVPFSLFISTYVFLPLFLIQFQLDSVTSDEMYTACVPFNCGNFTGLTYPFWSLNTQPNYCGHPMFKLDCQNGSLSMEINSQKFHILHLNKTSEVLRIARSDLWGFDVHAMHSCPEQYTDVNIDLHFFKYTSNNENYTLLYECGPLPDPPSNLSSKVYDVIGCLIEGKPNAGYLVSSAEVGNFSVMKCKNSIRVPGLKTSFLNNSGFVMGVLDEGFEVGWSSVGQDKCDGCKKAGDRCGYNTFENAVICLSKKPPARRHGTWKFIVGAVCFVLATFALITAITIYFYRRRNKDSSAEPHIETRVDRSPQIDRSQNLGVRQFTYSELEEATENFDSLKLLGEGATGAVFEGTLHDGHHVAVKRFNDDIDALPPFMLEVQSLAKLYHPNLVVLHGCTSLQSNPLMLVYEYVGNGSVDDHLHGDEAKYVRLNWNVRMNIAVETARALKYLHDSDIVHRDIKSSNILLDATLHAKLGDFGLARPFPKNESLVGTNPKGTIGYIDPEYRRQSELTHKSDVFSFGVVLIELVSSLAAFDFTRPEQLLFAMAKNIMRNEALDQLVDHTLGFDSDPEVNKMIRGVAELAVHCVEDSKDTRPSMEEVLEALENIQSGGGNAGQPEAVDHYRSDDDEIVELNEP